jgi:fructose-1,6-bisphosphatase/inositol monophosphatase family enzyme
MGGAGNKSVHVALGRIDCYISKGLDCWDMCGCEPIVKACGGFICDFNGDPIKYSTENTWLETGVVVCKDSETFEKVRLYL